MLDGHLDDLCLLDSALPLLHVGVGDQAAQISCIGGKSKEKQSYNFLNTNYTGAKGKDVAMRCKIVLFFFFDKKIFQVRLRKKRCSGPLEGYIPDSDLMPFRIRIRILPENNSK